MTSEEVVLVCTVVGGFLGLIRLWQIVVPKVREMLTSVLGKRVDLDALVAQVAFIAAELRNNGGGSLRDIVERVDRNQRHSDQRHKALMADMTSGVFEADKNGHLTYVNRAYCALTNRTPTELLGSGWVNTVGIDDRDRVATEWFNSIKYQREFEMEYEVTKTNGIKVAVFCKSYVLEDDHGKPSGFLGMITTHIL